MCKSQERFCRLLPGFVWLGHLWGRAGDTHSRLLLLCLRTWAPLPCMPIQESCRLNQCLTFLFDAPSADGKQVLVPGSKTKSRQCTACSGLPIFHAPGAAFCEMWSQTNQHGERILKVNFWSHWGAWVARSDAMQHFSPQGITTGAIAEGPSLHIRGKEYQQNKIKSSLSETHEDACRQSI